jgi:hypothetical protein
MTNSNRLPVCAFMVFFASCYDWNPTEYRQTVGALSDNPKRVWVTFTDGSHMMITHPSISGDSLAGFKDVVGEDTVRVAIPKTRISGLAVPKFNAVGTVGLILGVGLIASIAFIYLVVSSLPS